MEEEAGLQGLNLWWEVEGEMEVGHNLAIQPSLSTLLFPELMRPLVILEKAMSKAFRCLRLFQERTSEAISELMDGRIHWGRWTTFPA